MAKKKVKTGRKILFGVLGLIFVAILAIGYNFYMKFEAPNVMVTSEDKESFLYIRTGTTFEQLMYMLTSEKVIIKTETFRWVAVHSVAPPFFLARNHRC